MISYNQRICIFIACSLHLGFLAKLAGFLAYERALLENTGEQSHPVFLSLCLSLSPYFLRLSGLR